MDISVKSVDSKSAWEELLFSGKFMSPSFFNSWEWGVFTQDYLKSGFRRLQFSNEAGEPIGYCAVQFESGRFGKIAYVPFGPVCSDKYRLEILRTLANEIKDEGVYVLRIDPGTAFSSKDAELLGAVGFREAVRPIQSVNNWVVDIQEDEESQMAWCKGNGARKKLNKYIGGGRRKGVKVREIDIDEFGIFTDMIASLGSRIGVEFYSKEYFTEQFRVMNPRVMRCFVAEVDGKPLASAVVAMYGSEVSYLHGASYDESGKYDAAYVLHWEIMAVAREMGLKHYNFWGVLDGDSYIESNPGYGYSYFKRGFGGYVRRYLMLQEFPYSMLKYSAHRFLESYRAYKIKRLGGF